MLKIGNIAKDILGNIYYVEAVKEIFDGSGIALVVNVDGGYQPYFLDTRKLDLVVDPEEIRVATVKYDEIKSNFKGSKFKRLDKVHTIEGKEGIVIRFDFDRDSPIGVLMIGEYDSYHWYSENDLFSPDEELVLNETEVT